MKVLSKEEESRHYNAVIQGGLKYGLVGVGVGTGAATVLSRTSAGFRSVPLPFKTFLVCSAATFSLIIGADQSSRNFESLKYGGGNFLAEEEEARQAKLNQMSEKNRVWEWAKENRYKIIGGSWVASMAGAMAFVSRDRYLSTSQKIVQARMYAQGLTVLILLASAGLTISDDRMAREYDPKHLHRKDHSPGAEEWKEMVAAEWERERELEQKHAPKKGK